MNKLEIANNALARVGIRQLQSLDEDSADARLVNLLINDSILEVLREAKPRSARKRVELTRDSSAPLFGYSYQYQIPADYIGGLECYNSYGQKDETLFWEIEGDKILSNAGSLFCSYIYYLDDFDKLDIMTARIISLKLAIQLSFSKTENKFLTESLINEYEGLMLKKSRGLDTLENRADTRLEGEMDWITARNINFNP